VCADSANSGRGSARRDPFHPKEYGQNTAAGPYLGRLQGIVMDIQESMHRILERRGGMEEPFFYAVFFERHPEVMAHFRGTNLEQQAMLLTMALMVIERHYSRSYPTTAMYLKYLGTKHHSRGIDPDLYPKFRDAMLATLEEFHGSDWDTALAGQWRDAIDRAAATMLEGYTERFHV
jgi:hemoglobin-like flavoprotein